MSKHLLPGSLSCFLCLGTSSARCDAVIGAAAPCVSFRHRGSHRFSWCLGAHYTKSCTYNFTFILISKYTCNMICILNIEDYKWHLVNTCSVFVDSVYSPSTELHIALITLATAKALKSDGHNCSFACL